MRHGVDCDTPLTCRLQSDDGYVIGLRQSLAIFAECDSPTVRDLDHLGPEGFSCDAPFRKGEEMGWFEHGSTILVFAPDDFALCDNVCDGAKIRMGQPLMRVV